MTPVVSAIPVVSKSKSSPTGTLKVTLKLVALPASISVTASELPFDSEKTTGTTLVVKSGGRKLTGGSFSSGLLSIKLMAIVSVSNLGPPVPVLPLSLETIVSVVEPRRPGRTCRPAWSLALMLNKLPVNLSGAPGVPLPMTVTSRRSSSASRPSATLKLTSKLLAKPASISVTAIALKFPPDKIAGNCPNVTLGGKTFTGGSFSGCESRTWMLSRSVSVFAPPAPVFPRSSLNMVRVAFPWNPPDGTY